jgi:Zn-dependent peptidase ImmA (M78 family)/transcriptional regulator with XRE-family HTH domain
MPPAAVSTRLELGARIAEARLSAGKTQAQLAEEIGLERTKLVKIESGDRNVSATELVNIAGVLNRSIDWFVFESPPSVVSRRRDSGSDCLVLDNALDGLARDVEFLLDKELITVSSGPSFTTPLDIGSAIELAFQARRILDQVAGPIIDLQNATERLGLLAFSLELGRENGDAAYVEVASIGVALINGSTDVGRRRFSLAHELGHHLVGDAFEPVTGSVGDTEKNLNVFAVHFLMPGDSVKRMWAELSEKTIRLKALTIAVRFRVSWSAACSQLRNLGLIDYATLDDLKQVEPQQWEWVELGERWVAELEAPAIPPVYGRQVIEAYRSGRLTATRTVELLQGTLKMDELPPSEEITLEDLRPEFVGRP